MDRYPDYRFAASSAQHYAWLEQDAPELFARVAARIAEGRWEPVGGSWVEPDCNLPSGESLVRQLLYGQRYFESRFGRRCDVYWSPDTFGHNGQMPQILRHCGIERFLTQKLSWNQFTPPAARLVHLGRHRRLGGDGPPTADRHLQRGAHPGPAPPRRRRLPRSRPQLGQPGAVRPRRRRRRPDGRDARGRLADRGPARPAGARAEPERPVLRAARGRARRAWAGSAASSTSSTTAAPTRARPGPSAATARASGRCTTPRPRRRSPGPGGWRPIPPRRSRSSGRPCCATSSTTSSRAPRCARCTSGPSASTGSCGRPPRRSASAPSRRWPTTGPGTARRSTSAASPGVR